MSVSDLTADLHDALVELIRLSSTDLPEDIDAALRLALEREEPGSAGAKVFKVLLENIRLSREGASPLCQDTGTATFYVRHPLGVSRLDLEERIRRAVVEATERHYLRPNSVNPLSGESHADNLGPGMPVFHFSEWRQASMEIELLLKGGGCENVGSQFSLPDGSIGADRDLVGVKKCIVAAVHRAQGRGCAPGIIGVGVGGDRGGSYELAKEQLLRPLGDHNADPVLAELEEEMYEKCNELGIGPMGFGGKTTVIGMKAGVRNRIPASYFVSVAYACWAHRHRRLLVNESGWRVA